MALDPRERARLAAHYAVSTARAAATLLPQRPRGWAAAALKGLGPAPGRLDVDWAATPDPAHPRPVILLHGTNDTSAVFTELARALRAHGYAVFAPDYGHEDASARGRAGGGGTADIVASAGEIAAYVDRVRSVTGSARVDLVGHSQGGLHAHLFTGGVAGVLPARHGDVGRVVTMGATLRGASPFGPLDRVAHVAGAARALDAFLGPSARQQVRGSSVIEGAVCRPADTPGVSYTSIASRQDRTVRPASAQHLPPGPNVVNHWVDGVSHADLPRDPSVVALVLAALDGDDPA